MYFWNDGCLYGKITAGRFFTKWLSNKIILIIKNGILRKIESLNNVGGWVSNTIMEEIDMQAPAGRWYLRGLMEPTQCFIFTTIFIKLKIGLSLLFRTRFRSPLRDRRRNCVSSGKATLQHRGLIYMNTFHPLLTRPSCQSEITPLPNETVPTVDLGRGRSTTRIGSVGYLAFLF